MRKRLIIANWKMNLSVAQGVELAKEILSKLGKRPLSEIVIAPTFLHITELQKVLQNSAIEVAAQNMSNKEKGAFTGEISAIMLADLGVKKVLIGHSERRSLYGDTNAILKEKINVAIENNLTPVFCCGEPLEIRDKNGQNQYVLSQLEESIFHLSESDFRKVIIAYEPIWAIGTGVTASAEQAQEMHLFIRNCIAQKYSQETANVISILYGGSVNADNAVQLFAQPDVDGGLVGGASLKADEFVRIIND